MSGHQPNSPRPSAALVPLWIALVTCALMFFSGMMLGFVFFAPEVAP